MTRNDAKKLLDYFAYARERASREGDFECERFTLAEIDYILSALRQQFAECFEP